MKNNIIAILSFITIFLLVLNYMNCNKPVRGEKEKIHKSDTVVEKTSDTVWAKDSIYVYIKSPILKDSIYIYEPDTSLCNYIREYQDTINDTNITIYTNDVVKGKLLESKISYRLKVPIKITDSVKTTITKTVEPKYQIYAGATLSKNIIAPMLGVQKNSLYLQGGFNLIDKQPIIGLNYRFYSK